MPALAARGSAFLLMAADFGIVTAAYLAATYFLLDLSAGIFMFYEGGLGSLMLAAGAIIVSIHVQGLYRHTRLHSRITLALQFAVAFGIAFFVQALVHYVYRDAALPFYVMLAGSATAFLALLAWRLLWFGVIFRGFGLEPVLLVGNSPAMRIMGEHLATRRQDIGMTLVGYVAGGAPGTATGAGEVLGSIEALPEVCRKLRPDHVFIDPERGFPASLLHETMSTGARVSPASELYQMLFGRISTELLDHSAALLGGTVAPSPAQLSLQALYTNVLAIVCLLLLSPALLAIALLIKATSRGPVCELQPAMGWNLTPFVPLRFRCTAVASSGEVTAVGRCLRRLHLDGILQLVNVLRGEMAFAGPRPAAAGPAEARMRELPLYRQRFLVKPGLTGWAQVHGAPRDSMLELEYDLYYVKHVSVALDCAILWRLLRFFGGGKLRLDGDAERKLELRRRAGA